MSTPGRTILFAVVGNSDLALHEYPADLPHTPRSLGQWVLNHYDDVRGQLQAPILIPTIRRAAARCGRPLDEVVLFSTDQDRGSVREQEWQTDTIHTADALRMLLGDECAGRRPDQSIQQKEAIRVIPLKGVSPHLLDTAYLDLGKRLNASRYDPSTVDICFVSTTGGTTALVTSLVLHAIRRFGEKCRILYLPRGSNEARDLDFARQLVEAQSARQAASLAQAEQFGAIASVLSSGIERSPELADLANAANSRLEFDFDNAAASLHRFYERSAGHRPRFVERHLDQLGQLRQHQQQAFVRELHWNALHCLRTGRASDFVARIARLQEAILRYLAESLLGFAADGSSPKAKRAFFEKLVAVPERKAFLENQDINGQPLRFDDPTSTILLDRIIHYYTDGATTDLALPAWHDLQQRRELLNHLTALGGIKALRNRSIIGHDFRGIGQSDIGEAHRTAYQKVDPSHPPDPIADVTRLVELIGVDCIAADPFQEVRDYLISELGGV